MCIVTSVRLHTHTHTHTHRVWSGDINNVARLYTLGLQLIYFIVPVPVLLHNWGGDEGRIVV